MNSNLPKVKLECLECGKKFSRVKPDACTECPKCGGGDLDVAETYLAPLAL